MVLTGHSGRGGGARRPVAVASAAAIAALLLATVACSRETPAPAAPPTRPAVAPPPAAPAAKPATAVEPRFTYQAEGRRDPFRNILDSRVVEEGAEGIDFSSLKVAGIIWQRRSYFALVETADGLGHILRVNDPLGKTGRVRQITPEGVVIEVRAKDFSGRLQTRMITLEMKRDENPLEIKKDNAPQPPQSEEKKEDSQ
ncbi:MAG: pilus assembly protein PilP [candidate division NC10 bacterium]|nr:pilus assembly protein PilP [candidate division NC10 bacterium]